ncbi:O-succinylbenzoate synthase [Leifsonia rubra CMS 76R]|uniref:o-succinylbenzoate synthase n=1 Tax=Rhodoglobus vestalii TaxID=193384 RepID=A0A8H2K4A3_9MICO|nr:o-succinylbenzoate synthase [Rhodoglobus vestalii]EPR77106.1 O-succinylbenzoate synthase [Leifsonia rubra CMS 76R]TQO19513.1 O-succinylbenzoate synthase [Rhodoglobus vestalii]
MFPSATDILDTARVVSLPMTSRFRGIDQREALLFRGPQGWSEFSPFVEYDDAEATSWLMAAIDYAWNETPPLVRDHVFVNATVPAVDVEFVEAVLERFDGCRTAKVKVAEPGHTLADDTARIAEVRRVMGPEGRIRIDANGAWTVDEAERAVHTLAVYDLEYVEQPCATVEEMGELRGRIAYMGIPVAADESVRKAEDPLAVARSGAADLLVIKAQPLGGISRALSVVAQSGLPVVVSSALETSVGLGMGVHLAAAIDPLDFDCGLATASLLAADVTASPLRARGGRIEVRRVDADEALLTRWAANPERTQWWLSRLERCHELGKNYSSQ